MNRRYFIQSTGLALPAWLALRAVGQSALSGQARISGQSFMDAPVLEADFSPNGPFWQNAARTTPATANNDPARVWDDLAKGRHITSVSDARRPLVKTAVQNSQTALLLDGVDDYLAGASASDWKFLHDGNSFALFFVFKTLTNNTGTIFNLCGNNDGTASETGINVYLNDTTANSNDRVAVYQTNGSAANLNFPSVSGSCSSGAWHVLAILYTPGVTGNDLRIWVDNDFIGGIDTLNLPQASGNPSAPLHFGVRGSGLGGAYFSGHIGQMTFYSGSVNQAFITAQSTLLMATWGITDVGTLTASNRVTVIAGAETTENHTAFPAMCRCPNGDYIALICRASTHNNSNQRIVLRRSTTAGISWNSFAGEVLFQDTVGQADTGPVLSVVGTRIWASYVVVGYVSGTSRRVFLKYSDDSGVTWSSAIFMGDQGYTTGLATGGKVIQSQDDAALLMAVYATPGTVSPFTGYDSLMMQSLDNGATWTIRGTIAKHATDQAEEPQVNYLDDGRLMALVRYDNDYTIRVVYSSDHGATWTTPVWGFSGFGWPTWVQFSGSHNILALTRFFDPLYNQTTNDPQCYGVYRVSRDRGVTWTNPRAINSDRKWFYAYADVFEKSTGVAAILHAQADPNSNNIAIVEYLELADA